MFYIVKNLLVRRGDGNSLELEDVLMKSFFKVFFVDDQIMLNNNRGQSLSVNDYSIEDLSTDDYYNVIVKYAKYKIVIKSDFDVFSIELFEGSIRNKLFRDICIDDCLFLVEAGDGFDSKDFILFFYEFYKELELQLKKII